MLTMWRNYLTVAFRALARHKVYPSSTSSAWRSASPPACSSSSTSATRRATTMAARRRPGLPGPDASHTRSRERPGSPSRARTAPSPRPRQDFPQIEAIARAEGDRVGHHAERRGELRRRWSGADEASSGSSRVPFLRGDPATALKDVDGLVLSRSRGDEALRHDRRRRPDAHRIRSRRQDYDDAGHRRVRGSAAQQPSQLQHRQPLQRLRTGRVAAGAASTAASISSSGPGATAEEINRQLPPGRSATSRADDVGGRQVSRRRRFDWTAGQRPRRPSERRRRRARRPGNDARHHRSPSRSSPC